MPLKTNETGRGGTVAAKQNQPGGSRMAGPTLAGKSKFTTIKYKWAGRRRHIMQISSFTSRWLPDEYADVRNVCMKAAARKTFVCMQICW